VARELNVPIVESGLLTEAKDELLDIEVAGVGWFFERIPRKLEAQVAAEDICERQPCLEGQTGAFARLDVGYPATANPDLRSESALRQPPADPRAPDLDACGPCQVRRPHRPGDPGVCTPSARHVDEVDIRRLSRAYGRLIPGLLSVPTRAEA
jgi:hypothetical protein